MKKIIKKVGKYKELTGKTPLFSHFPSNLVRRTKKKTFGEREPLSSLQTWQWMELSMNAIALFGSNGSESKEDCGTLRCKCDLTNKVSMKKRREKNVKKESLKDETYKMGKNAD